MSVSNAQQLDRASRFADVWQRALSGQQPDLDYTLARPVSNLTKNLVRCTAVLNRKICSLIWGSVMAYSISIQEHVALAVSFRRSCGLFPTGLSDEQQQAFVKATAALAKPELILGTQKVQ